MSTERPIVRGAWFRPLKFPGHLIRVTRVAKDKTWADIVVFDDGASWSKRQPLIDGHFAFAVEEA
jgi:hypothetical protein